MRKLFKVISFLFLILIIVLVGFFFWASSSSIDKIEQAKLITNQYPVHIKNDSTFSIITYNIGYLSGMTNNLAVEKPKSLFDRNLKTVLTQFKKIDPDFIAFQEIDFASKRSYFINQQNEIAKLGYHFIGQSVNWDKKYVPFPYFPISLQFGKILSGQSVLSKYNILQQKRIELPRNQSNPFYYNAFYLDRLAQIVKIKIQNKILVLINVHLEAYHQDTRIIQTKKVMALYQQYNKTNPTILLGDFNSDINYKNSSIQLLMNLPKTKSAAFDNKNIQNTFNSLDPNERLDYIFYNTEFIEYIDGHILSEFDQASDHLPILMNFKFK